MSLKAKLQAVATRAAGEASARERGRVLWLLEEMISSTERELAKKVLIERDRQIATAKLELAKSLAFRLRLKIIAGEMPSGEEVPTWAECEDCMAMGTVLMCKGCYDAR